MKRNHHWHKRPITRRDFLAQGLIDLCAVSMGPTLVGSLVGQVARADGSRSILPTLVFDLVGGAGLPGNFLVGGAGGAEDLLKSYDVLGWNPHASASYDTSMGLPMAVVGQIRNGILQTTTPEARAKLRFSGLCHRGQDDSPTNTLSPISLFGKAGYSGKFINRALGILNTVSGGNSAVFMPESVFEPIFVQSVGDLNRLVGLSGGLLKIGLKHLEKIARTGREIGRHQVQKYESSPEGMKLKAMIDESFKTNAELAANPVNVDPRKDPVMQAVYGISASSAENARDVVVASIVFNALKENSGPGVIAIGGCDYHSGSNQPGDTKDLEIGREIGRAVQAAHRFGVPLFLHLITDGGVVAVPGTRNWGGDSGVRSMSVVGYYHPSQNPQLKTQGGHYTEFQAASTETLIGSDPGKATAVAFANWLNLQGRLSEFPQFIPEGVISQPQLKDYLMWG